MQAHPVPIVPSASCGPPVDNLQGRQRPDPAHDIGQDHESGLERLGHNCPAQALVGVSIVGHGCG